MKSVNRFWMIVVTGILAAVAATSVSAQKDTLFDTILAMDQKLFTAFNNRDIETTREIFDPDLEFFHDTEGLIDYSQAIKNSESLFAANTGLKRELLHNTMEVHPVPGYGAIQVGEHRFCHPEGDVMDCGTFKFLHVWKFADDRWTVTRVASYGH
ncbi:MAG: nuclear transport factor 2 family protein [Pseudomonadota bacterium]